MINLNPDIVCRIIEKAREFQAKEQVVIPETPDSPADENALQILEDHVDDMTYREVRLAIKDLEPDQQAELVALMWLGRGDYDLEDWERAVEDASDSWNKRTAEYLLATPLVSEYLTEGLYLHGYYCGD
ncbi:MAG: DUF3775 domain-containing protein [Deltaproteobacteria bacterium]|nr:DUF3775 domain-containing protein [Deltaproteobacteria bacterium]